MSPEIEAVLKKHGMTASGRVVTLGIPEVLPVVEQICSDTGDEIVRADTPIDAVKALRQGRISAAVAGMEHAGGLVRQLNIENLSVGVLAFDSSESAGKGAQLRAAGAMDVFQRGAEGNLSGLLRRALDFAALLQLELAHRCESRRLTNRELELLGQPPESMSDDLSVFQPPPLPVGPLSVYNLEEASEAFETAYIDRVQQLCNSAREAAVFLGVSSATLSRRQRRESANGS
ncbi:MAG: hypothetical protein AAF449_08060 [Myxococcota bacterium]